MNRDEIQNIIDRSDKNYEEIRRGILIGHIRAIGEAIKTGDRAPLTARPPIPLSTDAVARKIAADKRNAHAAVQAALDLVRTPAASAFISGTMISGAIAHMANQLQTHADQIPDTVGQALDGVYNGSGDLDADTTKVLAQIQKEMIFSVKDREVFRSSYTLPEADEINDDVLPVFACVAFVIAKVSENAGKSEVENGNGEGAIIHAPVEDTAFLALRDYIEANDHLIAAVIDTLEEPEDDGFTM